jgi:hypothetical protein
MMKPAAFRRRLEQEPSLTWETPGYRRAGIKASPSPRFKLGTIPIPGSALSLVSTNTPLPIHLNA